MKQLQIKEKTLTVPRGINIGTTIIESFSNYKDITVKALVVKRDKKNKGATVLLKYSHKFYV